jgi:hypothetical protein
MAALLLVMSTVGCYSWRPVSVGPSALINETRPRDVRVTLTDGTVVTMQNPMLMSDTIVGATRTGSVRAPTWELQRLEVLRFSVTRTTALVGLHVGAIVGIVAAIIAVQPHYHGF